MSASATNSLQHIRPTVRGNEQAGQVRLSRKGNDATLTPQLAARHSVDQVAFAQCRLIQPVCVVEQYFVRFRFAGRTLRRTSDDFDRVFARGAIRMRYNYYWMRLLPSREAARCGFRTVSFRLRKTARGASQFLFHFFHFASSLRRLIVETITTLSFLSG